MQPKFTHCDQEPVYVDNVPGKEYWYCKVCKNEVTEAQDVVEVSDTIGNSLIPGIPDDTNDWDDDIWQIVNSIYKT